MKIPDKLTRKILEVMSNMDAGSSCSLSETWDTYASVHVNDMCKKTGASTEELSKAVSFLAKNGLAEYKTLKSANGPVITGFVLTHEGLNWKEILRSERNDFLLKSVLVPIIVSVVTSLLISAIGYLWTMSGITNSNASQTPSADPKIEETIWTSNS